MKSIKIKGCLLVLLLTTGILAVPIYGAGPGKIKYQGRLRENGQPVSGDKNIDFKIYDTESGGSPVVTKDPVLLSVSTGIFSYTLDLSGDSLDWANNSYWLEIVVEGEPLAPREQLLSSPYSMYSDNSDKLDGRSYEAYVSTWSENQTIAGVKTFTSIPVLPSSDPTTDNQAVRKAYVDAQTGGGNAAVLTATQTFTGQNTFSNMVMVSSDVVISGTFDPNGAVTLPTTGISGAGLGSGLDADKLDNHDSSYFQVDLNTESWKAYDSARLDGETAAHYVDTTTAQNIGGKKIFADMVTVSSHVVISPDKAYLRIGGQTSGTAGYLLTGEIRNWNNSRHAYMGETTDKNTYTTTFLGKLRVNDYLELRGNSIRDVSAEAISFDGAGNTVIKGTATFNNTVTLDSNITTSQSRLTISSDTYIVGYASATAFYGNKVTIEEMEMIYHKVLNTYPSLFTRTKTGDIQSFIGAMPAGNVSESGFFICNSSGAINDNTGLLVISINGAIANISPVQIGAGTPPTVLRIGGGTSGVNRNWEVMRPYDDGTTDLGSPTEGWKNIYATYGINAATGAFSGCVSASSMTVTHINAFDTATSTIGTAGQTIFYGDGSNLTGVQADDADTLDSLDSSSFLRSDDGEVVYSTHIVDGQIQKADVASNVFVDTTTAQNIGGQKTFVDMVTVSSKFYVADGNDVLFDDDTGIFFWDNSRYSLAVGKNAQATGVGSIALGSGGPGTVPVQASGTSAVALVRGNAAGARCLAAGRESYAGGNDSFALGYKSSATATGAFALSDSASEYTVSTMNKFGAKFSGGFEFTTGSSTMIFTSNLLTVSTNTYIVGYATVTGNFHAGGDITCSGTKSFVEQHPTDPGKEIVYICLEGGEAGTYMRGQSEVKNGETVVVLPEHFRLVTSENDLTAQLTPREPGMNLYIKELTNEKLVVGGDKDGRFDYFVQGIRLGYENHQAIRDKY